MKYEIKENNYQGETMREIQNVQNEPYYDYDLQCYVVDGIVVKCGHIETLQGCYSCAHAGEKV